MSDSPGGTLPAAPASRATTLEAVVVFGVAIGPMLVSQFLQARQGDQPATLSDRGLSGLVLYEVLVTLALLPWLVRRGWSPRAIAGSPGPLDVARGAWLAVVVQAVVYVPWFVFSVTNQALAEGLVAGGPVEGAPLGALVIVTVSVVNPLFEEFLWLGYGVHRLAPRIGERAAIALSVLLRTSVHLYQGPWALLAVLPAGLALTWYYTRRRRLWPVIVAHLVFDAIGLVRVASGP